MNKNKKTKFLTKDIMKDAIKGAFTKLNPRDMVRNPVMFVVEICFLVSILLVIKPNFFNDQVESFRAYNVCVSLILFITILFANFA